MDLEFIRRRQTSPMLTSMRWRVEDDTESDHEQWANDFLDLPIEVRFGLGSDYARNKVLEMGEKYGLHDLNQLGEVSRIIRELFIKRVSQGQVVQRVMVSLNFDLGKAEIFSKEIFSLREHILSAGRRDMAGDFDNLPIGEALKTYKNIGESLIGEQSIKLELFNDPVKPSIKNWIEDYIQRSGSQKHTSLERSEYLFNSANARKLSSTDRDKLATILESYDEGKMVSVDRKEMEISFGAKKEEAGGLQNKTLNYFSGVSKNSDKRDGENGPVQKKAEPVVNLAEKIAQRKREEGDVIDLSKRQESGLVQKGQPSIGASLNVSKERNVIDLKEYL